uniref:STAS domain-containing protein n=1 Tax=Streptomyces sp. NPDC048481 TaxID=3365557 RepID=UPI0037235B28
MVEETASDIGNADQPARLHAEHRTVEDIGVVTLRGKIDNDGQERLSAALQGGQGAGPERIAADLSQVTFMDSTGINV